MTMQEIRERFPEPRSYDYKSSIDPTAYCIGGALCQSRGRDLHFPTPYTIGMELYAANPSLSYSNAVAVGDRIARLNDSGNFEAAWQALDEALRWGTE